VAAPAVLDTATSTEDERSGEGVEEVHEGAEGSLLTPVCTQPAARRRRSVPKGPAETPIGLWAVAADRTTVEVTRKEARAMTKTRIRTIFWGSLLAAAAGLVMLVVTGGLAYASDTFEMDGPDVVGIRSTPFGWTMIILAATALLVMLAGAVGQFVAWLGAVLNTAQLDDKTWFVVLLVTGLLSFGLVAMIAYLVAGPDDHPTAHRPQRADHDGTMPTHRAA